MTTPLSSTTTKKRVIATLRVKSTTVINLSGLHTRTKLMIKPMGITNLPSLYTKRMPTRVKTITMNKFPRFPITLIPTTVLTNAVATKIAIFRTLITKGILILSTIYTNKTNYLLLTQYHVKMRWGWGLYLVYD